MGPLLIALSLFGCHGKGGSETGNTGATTGIGGAPYCSEPIAGCIDPVRYESDVERFSVVRSPGTEGWQQVQSACAEELDSLGFAVELHAYGTGVNVIGRQAGTATDPRTVVVSAHYDHIADCSGADDNASGVAGVLEVARALAGRSHSHDLVIACWDEEELGLVGSMAYASEAAAAGEDIAVAISLEMIAYADSTPNSQSLPVGFDLLFADATAEVVADEYRGDFIALIADEAAGPTSAAIMDGRPTSLDAILLEIDAELLTNPALSDLQRSDHASFWLEGYSAIMVTDTANFRYSGYHCLDGQDDTIDRLDMSFATDVVEAVAVGIATVLQ